MRFPLVSRRAYDDMASRCVWLQDQLSAALTHRRRIERTEAGMTETPREEAKASEPMPAEVTRYLLDLSPPSARNAQKAEFEASYRDLGTWEVVLQQVRAITAK